MPSIIHKTSVEGFGISFIEAAQYGIPSIGGKDGGASDAIIHNKTGLICDGNSLDEIYSSIDNLFKLDLTKYISQILILIISLSLGFKSEKAILFIHSLSAFACIIPSLKYIPNTKTNIKSLIYSFKRNWSISKWLFSNSILFEIVW